MEITLNNIIQRYKEEECELFKGVDENGNTINTVFIFESHSDYLDKYLSFYKELPNLTDVIVFASNGTFKVSQNGIDYFIRHNHQEVFKDKEGNVRGIHPDICKQVRNNLIRNINQFNDVESFEEIMELVKKSKVKGFGELAIYDTSMRISKFKQLEPNKVYLHAGARKGFEVLESKGYLKLGSSMGKFVEKENLPEEFQMKLKPYEVENVACLYKEEFLKLPNR